MSTFDEFPTVFSRKSAFQGPCLEEWMPNIQWVTHLPSRFIPRRRLYTNVIFDSSTCLIIAASALEARFASFDEIENQTWHPDRKRLPYLLSYGTDAMDAS